MVHWQESPSEDLRVSEPGFSSILKLLSLVIREDCMKHIGHMFGSISHGTMQEEDLIPDFVEMMLKGKIPRSYRSRGKLIERRCDDPGYFCTDKSSQDLEWLFDALDDQSAPYFYFGAHPGDSSDYGYWLSEEWEQSLIDGGRIKVSDTSEIPTDHVGEVAVVNDHGNVTLYARGKNHRLYKVWSIV